MMNKEENEMSLRRAFSVDDIMHIKYNHFPLNGDWRAAFGEPEKKGVWFVWGGSGSGKTTFVLRLCKELSQYGKVAYNSLEEGVGLTMRNALIRVGMKEVRRRFVLLNESISELDIRLKRPKSPPIIVIDSIQYTELNAKSYVKFIKRHPNKLFVFVSQADGKSPKGRTANAVMYDASLKIYVEGYRAISKGRFFGEKGYYDIWPERSEVYWGASPVE